MKWRLWSKSLYKVRPKQAKKCKKEAKKCEKFLPWQSLLCTEKDRSFSKSLYISYIIKQPEAEGDFFNLQTHSEFNVFPFNSIFP